MPKALVDSGSGPWVQRALTALQDCAPRVVVIGAARDAVAALLPADVLTIDNPDHEKGMGSSLRVGLQALVDLVARGRPDGDDPGPGGGRLAALDAHRINPVPIGAVPIGAVPVQAVRIDAALVMLVDLPGVGREVVRRVCAAAGQGEAPDVVARAAFDGVPGHPVLLGRRHWPEVIASATGDSGARGYLARHPPLLVECGDLGSGLDVDTPDQAGR